MTGLALLLGGCDRQKETGRLQGYIEGDFVYVASPLAGKLETLFVEKGARIEKDARLFALENVRERAARDEAQRKLAQARANLEDVRKGKRPSEIDSLEAQLQQAKDALALSEKEQARQEKLAAVPGAGIAKDLDSARSASDQNRQRVVQLEADLKTSRLGSREDQVAASEAEVRALSSALEKSEWDLEQKSQKSLAGALVYDTFYRVGEWIPAGRPVVALLEPGHVKVRVYVPQELLGRLQPGGKLNVFVDGVSKPYPSRISYISTKAEYTPPVIYSRESRSKLVFLVEGVFDADSALQLHPGQPVDVTTGD